MATNETEIGARILNDIKRYNQANLEKIDEAAKRIQAEMLVAVRNDTPVSEENDEHLRQQWQKKAYGATGKRVGSNKYNGAVYAVRAKKKYQLVHLINFPHRIVVHGIDTGKMSTPVMTIPELKDYYQDRLDKEIERILNNG